MLIIGLTGGIGMGKSTIAKLFRRAHIPVFDADATVHALQAKGGAGVAPIAAAFPQALVDGRIERTILRRLVLADPGLLRQLEALIHPLVETAERKFIARARRRGAPMVVLDIPLLFETQAERRADLVIVVSAPKAVQRARMLRQRRLTLPHLEAILARQVPDRQQRRRADFVLRTGLSRRHAQAAFTRLLRNLRHRPTRPYRPARKKP